MPPQDKFLPNPKLKLREQLGEVCRFRRFSLRTEEASGQWIRRFIVWSGKRHPKDLGAAAVREFLTHLAVQAKVAASTQNQALNALGFRYDQMGNTQRSTFNFQ